MNHDEATLELANLPTFRRCWDRRLRGERTSARLGYHPSATRGAVLDIVTAWMFPMALGYAFTTTVNEVRNKARSLVDEAISYVTRSRTRRDRARSRRSNNRRVRHS